jgi:hypothetical protein
MGYLAVALRAAASDRVGFNTAGSVAGSWSSGSAFNIESNACSTN